MNGFQSTSINVNFFTGAVTSNRLSSGNTPANAESQANDALQPDANQLALERIREHLEKGNIVLNPGALPRSATDVATQVLKKLSTAIQAEPDEESRVALLEKAADSIAQGIAEARQLLSQAEGPQGQAAETIDAIAEKLQAGLQELVGNVVSEVPVNRAVIPLANDAGAGEVAQGPIPVDGRQLNIGAGELVKRSASISIETQDGDVINLDFNRSTATAVSVDAQPTQDGTAVSLAAARVVSSDLSYSVQGELDEGEVEALDELLIKISKVADRFFGGEIVAAFKKASHLELDTEELSGYSIALESVAVQQVVNSYQRVAELGNAQATTTKGDTTSATSTTTPSTTGVADAASAVGDVAQVVDAAAQQRLIADPQKSLPNIIETVARAKGFDVSANSAGQSFSEALGLLRDLITDLVLPTSADQAHETEHQFENEDDRDYA